MGAWRPGGRGAVLRAAGPAVLADARSGISGDEGLWRCWVRQLPVGSVGSPVAEQHAEGLCHTHSCSAVTPDLHPVC